MQRSEAGENENSAKTDDFMDVASVAPADMAAMVDDWAALASNAIDPNVFFEPGQLLPALKLLSAENPVAIVCVFSRDHGTSPRKLVGLVPFERPVRGRGATPRTLRVWHHPYSFLSTPLIHKDYPRAVWRKLFEWARSEHKAPQLIEFPLLLAEGPAYKALVDVVRQERLLCFISDHFTRAFLTDTCRADRLSSSKRSQLRRKRRRLEEAGRLEYRELAADGNVSTWVEDFLRLEASGWKGKEGTAMACRNNDADYFRVICLDAFKRGCLHMPALILDGRPIAMKCNFLSGGGAFWLKVAYDETLAKQSPGTLLELDNVANFAPGRWMDSCTAPTSYCDDIWDDRRAIQHVLISTSATRANLLVGALPLLRAVKRSLPLGS